MELVTDLSTKWFLQALRRFVGRQGRCSDIFSDNGTNFVGARNKLSECLKVLKSRDHHDAVSRECAKEGIHWHFNPPSAPHFGGIWEAAVRSAKHHLLRVIGETPLSPEDFSTLLVQVEACLNSRPLTPQSDDPNDLEPLTPAHFLIGSSLQAIPEPNVDQLPTLRLNRWQSMQRHLQTFWKRWRREYLCQLRGRTYPHLPTIPSRRRGSVFSFFSEIYNFWVGEDVRKYPQRYNPYNITERANKKQYHRTSHTAA
ncbi:uncharacterized protein LOC129719628 [Wyeomyia smithii]|uniref:uncharacterized protein LOC129719628 n=1 Tax=Wyeomyia smithii TaxID=174621 RepID=UPI002467E925|nr:uncharacterized protein LOC129719628 [Wyeomyia smithii]